MLRDLLRIEGLAGWFDVLPNLVALTVYLDLSGLSQQPKGRGCTAAPFKCLRSKTCLESIPCLGSRPVP